MRALLVVANGIAFLFSNLLRWNRIPDLEVLHAVQYHDYVKSGYARQPG
jgi:hypothetical protein